MKNKELLFDMSVVKLLLICMMTEVQCQTMPTGCTYDSGMFECDYSILNANLDIPVPALSFDPIPQRLRLINLPSDLSSSIFDGNFGNLSSTDYDTNFPATLELKCTNSTQSTTVASPFLANMGHVQDFRIINCALGNIPAGAFAELGQLDRFSIENGSISSMHAGMLNGVSISKDLSASPSFPIHRGEFSIKNTKLTGSIPADLLSSQTDLLTVILDGMDLTLIDASQFASNTKLRFLSLGWNDFGAIPNGLFDGLISLSEIRLYDTTVSCSSCDNLWFLTYAQDNHISVYGDIICGDGTYIDKYAMTYYNDVCAAAVAEECAGVEVSGTCITWMNFAMSIISFIAFVMGWIVLALTISIRGQLNPGSGGKKSGNTSRKQAPPIRKTGPANTRKGWA